VQEGHSYDSLGKMVYSIKNLSLAFHKALILSKGKIMGPESREKINGKEIFLC
jgi:hypothetical protein